MAFYIFPMKEGERSLEVFKLIGKLIVEHDEAVEGLNEAKDEAKKTGQ